MIFDPKLLDSLGELPPTTWEGTVYRHMFASYPPERENTSGARWNPPEVAAIYACLERETLLAEVEHQLVSQPIPLKRGVRRTIYIIKVGLHSVLDLSSREELDRFGINVRVLADYPYTNCQSLGGAVAWLEHDGLLVPSARHEGTNLVIYPTNQKADYLFDVIESEVIN